MLTLDLKLETEQRLHQSARNVGKTLEQFIEDVLAALVDNADSAATITTGAQLLYELKSLNLSPEYGDSSLSAEAYAKKLREESNRSRYA